MSDVNDALTFAVLPHAAEGSALLPLFEQVFGVRLTLFQWQWKYADERSFHVVCRDANGALVGHAAVQYAGQVSARGMAGQVGDVMVHPAHRGMMQGGVFARMLDLLAQEAVRRGYALCYGFPGERPAKLGLRLGIYEEVGRPVECLVSPGERGWQTRVADWRWPVQELSDPDAVATCLELLGSGARLARDARFLHWRYVSSPTQYRVFAVGGRWSPATVIICRDAGDQQLLVVEGLGLTPITIGVLCAIARKLDTQLRIWPQLLRPGHGLPVSPTPFVAIRLAKVGNRSDALNWFDVCQPGDVDVF